MHCSTSWISLLCSFTVLIVCSTLCQGNPAGSRLNHEPELVKRQAHPAHPPPPPAGADPLSALINVPMGLLQQLLSTINGFSAVFQNLPLIGGLLGGSGGGGLLGGLLGGAGGANKTGGGPLSNIPLLGPMLSGAGGLVGGGGGGAQGGGGGMLGIPGVPLLGR